MAPVLAGFPSFWSLFWVVFVIVPAVRWSVGWSWSRRRWWRVDGWDTDDDRGLRRPGRRRQVAELQAELETRNGDIEMLTARVGELENRIDFAERLLAGRRDPTPILTPSRQDWSGRNPAGHLELAALPLRPRTPDA